MSGKLTPITIDAELFAPPKSSPPQTAMGLDQIFRDQIFRDPATLPQDADTNMARCILVSQVDRQSQTVDESLDAYKAALDERIEFLHKTLISKSHGLSARTSAALAWERPFQYVLNILKAGEEVNAQFGFPLIAEQCRHDIKIMANYVFALDGVPSEFWGTLPEIYNKELEKLAEEGKEQREAALRNAANNGEILDADFWHKELNSTFISPFTVELKKGIFWRAEQMAYGRVKIAPIDWSTGLVQGEFFEAVKDAILVFRMTKLRKFTRLPLKYKLFLRFGFSR